MLASFARRSVKVLAWVLAARALKHLRERKLGKFSRALLGAFLIGHALRGPSQSWLYALLGINKPKWTVTGSVALGYERVRTVLMKQMANGLHNGTQVVAYVRGEKVVDLVGVSEHTYRGKKVKYNSNSTQNIFSCTKVLTGLVCAMLRDKNQLDLDSPIAKVSCLSNLAAA